MDYGGAYPGSSAIAIIPDASGPPPGSDSWNQGGSNQPPWATDDDYHSWNEDAGMSDAVSNASFDSRRPQSRAGSEQPPVKRSRNNQGDAQSARNISSRAIGKMFFKTKLCCKFRAGTCPYITNCNFAHGLEELRKPPPNWQDIVAAHEEGIGQEPREELQIPALNSSTIVIGESERSHKARRCKKFYTDEGCPYGDNCTFLHDEQSKARESVAISLSPTVGGGGFGVRPVETNQKPSNWKTRICNKWETTGYCPFGNKCHFAHGTTELHKYVDGPIESEARDPSMASSDVKQLGVVSNAPLESAVASSTSVPHTDVYRIGVPSQRPAGILQRQGQRTTDKWRGPDKFSKIYGDWIDDFE